MYSPHRVVSRQGLAQYMGAKKALLSSKFNLLSVFKGEQPGFWYPQDLAVRYQESTGVTPAAINQPEGFVGDKRLGFVTSVLFATARPNLVAAGTTVPTVNTGDTFLSVPATSIAFPTLGAGGFGVSRGEGQGTSSQITLAANAIYRVRFSVALSRALTGAESIGVVATGSSGTTTYALNSTRAANEWLDTGLLRDPDRNAGAHYPVVFASTALTSPVTVYVRDYYAETVLGNHATQATAAARPTLSARVNLLLATEGAFSGASWTKVGTPSITLTAGAGPSGESVDLITSLGTLGGGTAYFYNANFSTSAGALPIGTALTPRIQFKRISTSGTVSITNPSGAANGRWDVNLALLSADWETITSSHAAVTVVAAFTVAVAGQAGILFTATATSIQFYATRADVRTSAGAALAIPAYQRVTTATDYDTVGFPFFDSLDGTQQHTTSTTGGGSTAGFNYWGTVCPTGSAGTNRTIYDDGAYRVRINAANKLELGSAKTVTYGPNLVTNPGPFVDTAGWTGNNGGMLSVVAGELVITATLGLNYPGANTTFTLVNGKTYEVSITSRRGTTTDNVGLTGGVLSPALNNVVNSTTVNTTYTSTHTATGTTSYLQVFAAAASSAVGTTVVTSISIREKIAHHLVETAATVAVGDVAVATLWQEPRGKVNLVGVSEPTIAVLTASNVTNTTMTGLASAIAFGDNSVARYALPIFTPAASTVHTLSVYIEMTDGGAPVPNGGGAGGDFSLSIANAAIASGYTVTLVSGTRYRVSASATSRATPASIDTGVYKFTAQSARTFSVSGYHFSLGSELETYQRVVSASDFDDRLICAQLGNGTIAQTGSITALAGGPGYAVGRDYAVAGNYFFGRLYDAVGLFVSSVSVVTRLRVQRELARIAGVTLS